MSTHWLLNYVFEREHGQQKPTANVTTVSVIYQKKKKKKKNKLCELHKQYMNGERKSEGSEKHRELTY